MTRPSDDDVPADRELAALLGLCRTPAPPAGLFERAVRRATLECQRAEDATHLRRRRLAAGVGAAAVAGLALWFAGALPFVHYRDDTDLPTVNMSLHEPATVRLVFAAEKPLADATMTVTLPDGVELEGFPGEHEIQWETSLAEGRNLLPLTLIAKTPAGGEMRARLEHDSRDREFRVRIEIG